MAALGAPGLLALVATGAPSAPALANHAAMRAETADVPRPKNDIRTEIVSVFRRSAKNPAWLRPARLNVSGGVL